jgi:asparagine synthase (glutamine-hydrolysing)
MCGVIGITGNNEKAVREAAKCFAYRGPDALGIYSDSDMTLGHNRLSIIDLDPRSNQPFFDESKQVGLVFNGEIYNFKKLREDLEKTGKFNLRTQSDTEILVYGYIEWGAELFNKLRGMYALAIYDKRVHKLMLVSDISAIKPMYYTHVGNIFAFSSEIKGILSLLRNHDIEPQIDQKALELYFAFGYIPAPRTLYAEIKRMPPCKLISYDLKSNKLEEGGYELSDNVSGSLNEAELQGVIEDSVKAHLVADVPVGVFFSGGTDSSLITAILNKLGVRLETFSLAIKGRGADQKYFDAIAKELDIKSHVSVFNQEAFEEAYKEVMGKLDEPIASNGLLPTYALAKSAASKVKVVLSGEGGDEFFSGYPRQLVLNSPNNREDHFDWVDWLYLHIPNFPGKNRVFERIFARLSKKASYYLLTMSSSRDLLMPSSWRNAHRELSDKNLSPARYDEMLYLPNDLLRKLDLATMYTSIEGRVPLIDREVIAASRKFNQQSGSAELKPALKAILTKYISPELVYRKKSGFGLHLPIFFENAPKIRTDLVEAINVLEREKMLPLKSLPPVPKLISRYPNLAWAILVLFRVLKNNGKLK